MSGQKEREFVFVYSTFPNRAVAEKVARALVEARLAACVNIFPPMVSLYEWEGEMKTDRETAVLIKTRGALAERAIALARPLHPYARPCFLVLPIESGSEDYLAWVREQTGT